LGLHALDARERTARRFGADADARWTQFAGALGAGDRIDILLRDAAGTWGAAFSPSECFGFFGLADDEPFGPDWGGIDDGAAKKLLADPSGSPGLLEAPETKRRWSPPDDTKAFSDAVRTWLLERIETAFREQISDLVDGEGVPFLAGYRDAETGMEKRASWEETWRLQRLEDEGKLAPELARLKRKTIPAPDKYGQQKDRLVPLLAGIHERVPWLLQRHNEPSAAFGGMKLGEFFRDFVAGEAHSLGVAVGDLRTWTPPAATKRTTVDPNEVLAALRSWKPEVDEDEDGDEETEQPEGPTGVDLATDVGVKKALIEKALKKLEADGLVEKLSGWPARYVATGDGA
jgi:hypothetical protein